MDIIGIRQLHNVAIGEFQFEEVRFPCTIRGKDEVFLVEGERRGQEVEIVVNRGVVCELIDMRARLAVLEFASVLKDERTLWRSLLS